MSALDPRLREFANDKQWRYLEALIQHGSERKAGAALGVHDSVIHRAKTVVLARAAQHGYAPDHAMLHQAPPGFRVRRNTTLRDMRTGESLIQWQSVEPDKEQQEALFREAVEAMTADVPRFKPTRAPAVSTDSLLSCYPIGDHHVGMLAWAKETGADYDLSIAENLLTDAMRHLVAVMPASEEALIAVLGDYFHYESFKPLTPTSGHLLDADSRFPKMVAVGIRLMRTVIELARQKHAKVRVIIEIGNHDPAAAIFMMQLLANVYENEPRVTIDTSPMNFHFFRFGRNLLMTHHGDRVKLQDLPLIMASDQPKCWGETEHRYIWTGHVHHKQKLVLKEMPGVIVESFPVLASQDAYAAKSGYRAKQQMHSIVIHRENGEMARHTVNPGMFA